MGYGIVCPGYDGVCSARYQCDFKKEYDGSSDVFDSWYEAYCNKDYERGGYGDCKYYKKHMGICYITTAVCDTLGFKNDNLFLSTICSFREKLEQDPKMFKQLEIYDIVGPVIANIINGDKEIAAKLFKSTISPVCMDIINGNYNDALLKYTCMIKSLINKYKDSVSIGLDVFKMSDDIGQVKYCNQYKKCLNFGEKFRRY